MEDPIQFPPPPKVTEEGKTKRQHRLSAEGLKNLRDKKFTKEGKKNSVAQLAEGRKKLAAMREAKRAARLKALAGEQLTPEEAAAAAWKSGHGKFTVQTNLDKERDVLRKTAELVIKPQAVSELRLKVERAAAKYDYDPLEALIRMTQEDDLKAEEKISIHKTLLPYLVPQMPAIPKENIDLDKSKVKVVITQLVYQPQVGNSKLPDQVGELEVMPPEETPAPAQTNVSIDTL